MIEKTYNEATPPTHSMGTGTGTRETEFESESEKEVSTMNNQLLSSCLYEKLHHWAWYPCLPLPPFLSNLFYHHGIYPSIDRIHANCIE